MKNKIKEVQKYFVDKIVDGDFEIGNVTGYTARISVDKIYGFSIWLGNGSEYVRTYDGRYNFIELEFSKEQKPIVFKYFKTLQERNTRDTKLELLRELKEELGL